MERHGCQRFFIEPPKLYLCECCEILQTKLSSQSSYSNYSCWCSHHCPTSEHQRLKNVFVFFSNFVPCDFWPSCRAAEIRSWPPVNKQRTALPKLNHKLCFIKACKSVLVTVYHSPSLYKQVLLKASKEEELAAMVFSWAE